MQLSVEQQAEIMSECAYNLKMDCHINYMNRKADAHTWAERNMVGRTYRKGMPYKRSYLWCDTVDICFYFDDNGKACATMSSAWSFDGRDMVSGSAVKAVEKIREMLKRMQLMANANLGVNIN
ncbi:hypothetical protein ACFC0X_24920 [Paenibacillus chitinolyticus]|uniref:hypothetical protein n=1 Tax=Paenibacillus chitinolyticus TaxID=79263 RepID=UPI0035DF136A